MSLIFNALSKFGAACQPGGSGFFGLPTWYKYLEGNNTDTPGRCTVMFNFPEDISAVLLAVIEILLRIGVMVAVAYVIYGGIRYVLSQGEPDKLTSARKTIINALIGIAISLVATGAVAVVARTLTR